MDPNDIDKKVDEFDASRPGAKTLAAAVVVGLFIIGIYYWSQVKAAFDML